MTNIEKAQTISEIVDRLEKIIDLADEMSTSSSDIHRFIYEEMTEDDIPARINVEYHSIRECANHIRLIVNGSIMSNLEKLA